MFRRSQDRTTTDHAATRLALPLVSIIITAHNYGRFLRASIASVRAQTYRDVECIVVNDSSSDGTSQILDELKRTDKTLVVLTNETCLGQGASSRIGFRASRGQYIVFMDADDVLAPNFVLEHVYIHLSSRTHVGFTCSDVYQTTDDRVVLSTGSALNAYLLAHPPLGEAYFRPVARQPEGPWTYDTPGTDVLRLVHYAPPGHANWCWSPTTANMFRRDVLNLFADCDEFDQMRLGIDAYLCIGISNLCGSLLIDKPLSTYRIHGSNNGSYLPQLQNVRAVHRESELSVQAIQNLIGYLTRNAVDVCGRLWHTESFIAALNSLDAAVGGPGPASRLAQCFDLNGAVLASAIGEARLAQWKTDRMSHS